MKKKDNKDERECRFGAVTLQQTHVKLFKDDCPKDDDAANYIKLMFPLHFLHSFLYFLSPHPAAHSLSVLDLTMPPKSLFHGVVECSDGFHDSAQNSCTKTLINAVGKYFIIYLITKCEFGQL